MKRFLSIVLIVFTLGLFINNSVNWHYHQLPNGIIVEHAHPYKKAASTSGTPFEKHSHSELEFLILDLVFYSGLVIVLAFFTIQVYRDSKLYQKILTPEVVFYCVYASLPLLRAPPAI